MNTTRCVLWPDWSMCSDYRFNNDLWLMKEKEFFIWFFIAFPSYNFDFETWNDDLYDSQLVTRWDSFWSDLTVKIVYGVGSAHNKATYLMVSRPNLVTCLEWTPIFEWCVIRCESQNKHQKDMFYKIIRLCAHNLLNILGSTLNMIYALGGGNMLI